ncbi:hypothetical protein B0T14DRAFT_531324 [Immersiella caudata]|uniref:Uncharacterized protein n=1 Tax=Immersiella caudata TaxID=314043 RepID=A0AA39TLR2_9PEZI|nr:hypothetical protein B0T14DRAFT_531324 [Immersiella caudata]
MEATRQDDLPNNGVSTSESDPRLLSLLSLDAPRQNPPRKPVAEPASQTTVDDVPLLSQSPPPPPHTETRTFHLAHKANAAAATAVNCRDPPINHAAEDVSTRSQGPPSGQSSSPRRGQTERSISADTNSSVSFPTTSTSLPASTAPTSQLSSEEAFYEVKCGVFVALKLEMSPKDHDVWINQISQRLRDTLKHKFRSARGCDPTVVLEFMMAGPTRETWNMQPTIFLTCCHGDNQKKLRKMMKKQNWLSEYPYQYVINVDSVPLFSHGTSLQEDDPVSVRTTLYPWSDTLCGIAALADTGGGLAPVQFTLGGVIVVGGRHYVLTVGHVLDQVIMQRCAAIVDVCDTDSDSSGDDDSNGNSAFMKFPGDPGKRKAVPGRREDSTSCPLQLPPPAKRGSSDGNIAVQGKGAGRHCEVNIDGQWNTLIGDFVRDAEIPTLRRLAPKPSVTRSLDWALIDLERPGSNLNQRLLASNFVQLPHLKEPMEVDSVLQGLTVTGSEVWINSGISGVVRGWMTDCPVTLCLGHSTMDARQVIPEKPMTRGDSGAWVLKGNQVCGHVVAGRGSAPWVYIVPMDRIFADIRAVMSESEVRLPRPSDQSSGITHTSTTLLNFHTPEPTEKPEPRRRWSWRSDLAQTDVTVLTPDVKTLICEAFWGPGYYMDFHESVTYWEYYRKKISIYRDFLLHTSRSSPLVKTHGDLFELTQMLKYGMLRDEIRVVLHSRMSDLGSHVHTGHQIDLAIDLAVGLLTMLDIKSPSTPKITLLTSRLQWEGGSLEKFVSNHFSRCRTLGGSDAASLTLRRDFNAINLERTVRLRIAWTDNLDNHLLLDDEEKTVHVFYHASFLERQRKSATSLLPKPFIEETLCTLELLFPRKSVKTANWLAKKVQTMPCGLDKELQGRGCAGRRSHRIEHFQYWGDRLVVLCEACEESRPRTIKQWWYDRRDSAQWFTLWAVILFGAMSFILGFVQVVVGVLQLHYSYRAGEIVEKLGGGP